VRVVANEGEQRVAENAGEVFAVAEEGGAAVGFLQDEIVFAVEDAFEPIKNLQVVTILFCFPFL
jgi:hypothetical protein